MVTILLVLRHKTLKPVLVGIRDIVVYTTSHVQTQSNKMCKNFHVYTCAWWLLSLEGSTIFPQNSFRVTDICTRRTIVNAKKPRSRLIFNLDKSFGTIECDTLQ